MIWVDMHPYILFVSSPIRTIYAVIVLILLPLCSVMGFKTVCWLVDCFSSAMECLMPNFAYFRIDVLKKREFSKITFGEFE